MGHPTDDDASNISSTQPLEAPQLPQYARVDCIAARDVTVELSSGHVYRFKAKVATLGTLHPVCFSPRSDSPCPESGSKDTKVDTSN
ncbi:unnamed protein product, partial [Aphanomyces euteiches]